MKTYLKYWVILLSLVVPCLGFASNIDYCPGSKVTTAEDSVIQRLVPQFGNIMGCEVGDNCLKKWDKNGELKFTIAWKKHCGPIINGNRQKRRLLYAFRIPAH